VYKSEIRAKQAEQTKEKILSAARSLFRSKGFDGTAIDAIAAKAGVAAPTVYAIFGSKKEILKQLVDQASFGQNYNAAVETVLSTKTAKDRLRAVAAIPRRIFDSDRTELDLFRNAGVISPEILALEKEREDRRYQSQKPTVEFLMKSKGVRSDLNKKRVSDILWSLTSRQLYRMLVIDREWTSDEYEEWLADTLIRTLLK